MDRQEIEIRIAEIEDELKYFEIDPEDYEDEYREVLNEEGDVRIGDLAFEPARIVEELDPIAYRCGLNDFVDGLEVEDDPRYQELVEELEELKDELEDIE
jgi:hypothetical protein